jgi:hypothetical protein
VTVISRASAAFMNQVVWELADPDAIPGPRPIEDCTVTSMMCVAYVDASGGDIPIDVTVSGIIINGVETTHSYRVTIFDAGSDAPPPAKGSFVDDDGSVFEADIERLAASGITRGCNPPVNDHFCPADRVTRGQMAAFLHRALPDLAVTGSADFIDTTGSVFEADVDWLAGTGVTRGCNPPANDRFCPGDYVTRGQMAAFLVRALGSPDRHLDLRRHRRVRIRPRHRRTRRCRHHPGMQPTRQRPLLPRRLRHPRADGGVPGEGRVDRLTSRLETRIR